MNRTLRCATVLWLAAAAGPGCAPLKSALPKSQDVAQQRRRRNEQLQGHFQRQRGEAELQTARAEWLAGDEPGAVTRLRRVLDRNPDHVDARLLLAKILLDADRPDEAVEAVRPAADAHPDDAQVRRAFELARDAAQQWHTPAARFSPEEAGDPGNPLRPPKGRRVVASGQGGAGPESGPSPAPMPPAVRPASCERPERPGEPALLPGDPAGTKPSDLLNARWDQEARSTSRGPASAGATGAEPVGSSSRGGRADPIDQTPAGCQVREGATALEAGDAEAAMAHFQQAIALDPRDPQIPISAAVAALRRRRPDLAVRLLEPEAGRFGDSAALRRVLGAAYYRQGDFRASQTALQQALSLDKSSALSYFLMGCTLVKLGQPEAAEQYFQQARLIDPRLAVRH